MHPEQHPAGRPPPVRDVPPGSQYGDPRWGEQPSRGTRPGSPPGWDEQPGWGHEPGWSEEPAWQEQPVWGGQRGRQEWPGWGDPPAQGGWQHPAAPPGGGPDPRRGRPAGRGPRFGKPRLVIGVVAAVMVLAAGSYLFLRGQGGQAPGQTEEGAEAAPPPLQLPPGVERASIGVMPTAENTGVPAGLTLRPSGPLTITEPGAVVEGLDIDGCVQINASDVTLRYSRIRCDGDEAVLVGENARNVVLEDIEIDGLGNPRGLAVGFGNYTLRRANIHSIGDGPRMSDNTVVESSFIHDIAAITDGHNDGMQVTDGSNIVVRGNRVENLNSQTSAIFIGADLGNIDKVLVEGNWLNGGGFTVYAGNDPGHRATNIQVLNNKFGRDHVYGPLETNSPDTLDWRDNTYADNGEAITP